MSSPLTLAVLEARMTSSWLEGMKKTCDVTSRIAKAVKPVMMVCILLRIAPVTPYLLRLLSISMHPTLFLKNLGNITAIFIGIFVTCKLVGCSLNGYVRSQRAGYFQQLMRQYFKSSDANDIDLADQATHVINFLCTNHQPNAKIIILEHLEKQEPGKALAICFAFFLPGEENTLPNDTDYIKQLVEQIMVCCKTLNYSGAGSVEIALDAITMLRDPQNRAPHLQLLEQVCRQRNLHTQADWIQSLHTDWPKNLDFLIMREQGLAACIYTEQRDWAARKRQVRMARDFIQLTPAHFEQTKEHVNLVTNPPDAATRKQYHWEDASGYALTLEIYCKSLSRLNAQGLEAFMRLANGTASTTMRAWHFHTCYNNQDYRVHRE